MSPDNCLPVLVGFHSPTKKFHHNYSKTRGPLSQHVWHVYLYLFEFMLLPLLTLIRAQIGERLLISTLLSNLLFFLSSSVLLFCRLNFHTWDNKAMMLPPTSWLLHHPSLHFYFLIVLNLMKLFSTRTYLICCLQITFFRYFSCYLYI